MFASEIKNFDDELAKADVCADKVSFPQAMVHYLNAIEIFLPHCSKTEFPSEQLAKFVEIAENLGAIFKLRGKYDDALKYFTLVKEHGAKINFNLIRVENAIQEITAKLESMPNLKIPKLNFPIKNEKKLEPRSSPVSLPDINAKKTIQNPRPLYPIKLNLSFKPKLNLKLKTIFIEPPDQPISSEDDPALLVFKDQLKFLKGS